MCTDVVVAYFNVLFCLSISLEWLRITMKTAVCIDGLRAEIWTRDLPSTKQECFVNRVKVLGLAP
jgi:hypothetical protein